MKKVVAILVLLSLAAVFVSCGSQVQNGIDQFAEMLEKAGIKDQVKLLSKAQRESQIRNALQLFRGQLVKQKISFTDDDIKYFEKKIKPLYNL